MATSKYPRTLYKNDPKGSLSFTNKLKRNVRYDSLIVNNAKEQDAAEEMGYIDSFHDAIFPPEGVEEVPEKEAKNAMSEGF